MIETALMIAAGYFGYAAQPWWWASVAGLVAGAVNVANKFRMMPDRDWPIGARLYIYGYTMAFSALMLTAIYFAARFITQLAA